MSNETEYSLQARTNPVYLTAKTAVCLMADAGIPDAADIVRCLNVENNEFGINDPDIMLGNELVVESKFRTMCKLIEDTGIRTSVDLPCGYTPKALHLSEKGLRFIGLDLPIVASEIEPVILGLAAHPERIRFHGIDATNLESLQTALRDVEGPLCITTEGMMMYFTENEASTVVSNIRSLLEEFGGCWITPDPEFIVQFFLTFKSVLGENAVQKLLTTRETAKGQSDVINLTNSFIVNPANTNSSVKTAKEYLHRHGLKAECINLAENMPDLSVYRKLTKEQIKAFKSAMQNCNYWKITFDETLKHQGSLNSSQPFGLDAAVENDVLKVSLRGRMDTITAPELLKTWETEKSEYEINAVEIDCSELQYISSAGLRVLLMICKALDDKGKFMLKHVRNEVREILEMTGFDQFLL